MSEDRSDLVPVYTDAEMSIHAARAIEMLREALPTDMRVMIIVVGGHELGPKYLRTRMVTNMDPQIIEGVMDSHKFDGQVVIPKKHFFMQFEPGKYAGSLNALDLARITQEAGE